jgi:hypothetical protein
MKRIALILCVAGLLASLPCFAAAGTPPAAPSHSVSAALPFVAPAPAPLPSWLAPQAALPTASPASTSVPTKLLFGITPCTIDFCDSCGGCCRATSRGCACC